MGETVEDRALWNLREAVDAEIFNARQEDGGDWGYFTVALMGHETFDRLHEARDAKRFIVLYQGTLGGYSIVASLWCFDFRGHICLDEKMPLGKVVIRRSHYDP